MSSTNRFVCSAYKQKSRPSLPSQSASLLHPYVVGETLGLALGLVEGLTLGLVLGLLVGLLLGLVLGLSVLHDARPDPKHHAPPEHCASAMHHWWLLVHIPAA